MAPAMRATLWVLGVIFLSIAYGPIVGIGVGCFVLVSIPD